MRRVVLLCMSLLLSSGFTAHGPLLLFRFADPDGNVVEYFSLAPTPRG